METFKHSCFFRHFSFLLFSASLTFLHAPHLSLTTLFLQHVGVLFEFSLGTVTTLCSVKNDSLDCNTSRGDARQETPFFSIDLCCHFEQTLYCRNCKILFPQYRILLCPLNNHSSWCWPAFRDLTPHVLLGPWSSRLVWFPNSHWCGIVAQPTTNYFSSSRSFISFSTVEPSHFKTLS